MSEIVQLKDTCEWLLGGGILSSLTANFDVPWKTSLSQGQPLDDDYYGNHSGDKPISPLVEKLVDNDNQLNTVNTLRLATLIYNKYKVNWDRAWLALSKEYNPIDNYKMREEETPAETTLTLTPAETTTTTKVPETTKTLTPAETKVETKVAEYNREITPAETVTTTTVPETTKSIKTPETTTTTKLPETTKTTKVPETTTSTKTPETTTKITPSLVKETQERFINGFDSSTATPSDKTISTPQLISGGTGEEKVTQGAKAGEQKVEQGTHAGEEKLEQGLHAGEEKVEQGLHAGEEKIEQGANAGEERFEQGSNAGADNVTQGDNPGEETLSVIKNGEEKVTQGLKAGEEVVKVDNPSTHVSTVDNNRILERIGNIGVTTTQKMLTDELELRKMYNFFDTIVYPQLDKIMCMSYYKDVKTGLY